MNEHPLIAVVDDEASVRRAIQRLMRALLLRVETYGSGAEFLANLRAHAPDCIILDLHMPEVNGFDVLARLAEAGAHAPVIVITGHDSPEVQARAVAAGAAVCLRKPVDDQALLEAIRQALGGR